MIANIHFYLKPGKPNKKGEKPIIMRITYNNQRSIIHLGCMVKPKYWAKNQFVRPNPEHETDNFHQTINNRIRAYRTAAEDAISDAIIKGITLSDAYLKNHIKNPEQLKNANKSFYSALDEFIETGKATKAERTIKGYNTTKNYLTDFESFTKYKIDFNTINLDFYDKLKTYSFSEKKIHDNYFAKLVNVLKAFLKWAEEREYHNNRIYERLTATERDKEVIFLSMDELMKLKDFEFKTNYLRKARDIFCFGCFTGLRISDIMQLTRDHIRDGQIVKSIQKTRQIESVPVNKFAQEILDRYPTDTMNIFPGLSSQKLNKYIKECCEEAEFNERIKIVKYSGNKPSESTEFKYNLITSHVARKTFITNSLILNMNQKAIKEIVGHKKDSTFNKYLKITEEYKKTQMRNTWDQFIQKEPSKDET